MKASKKHENKNEFIIPLSRLLCRSQKLESVIFLFVSDIHVGYMDSRLVRPSAKKTF